MKMTELEIHKEELSDEGESSGIEQEDELIDNHEPFDPASISLSSKVVALDTVLRRIKNGTIKLAPDFQRNHVWNIERKSLLIESMMLRIPLPMFYVSEDSDGVWEVVDGLQRLTTIKDFVLGEDNDGKGFKLKSLEFWGEALNNKDFYSIEHKNKMPRIINNIMEAELSFTIINPDTPEKVKRNIFKRINTGGMRLSVQEIRHALYQGKATKLLKELVACDAYREVIGETVKDSRMGGRELILRYISFNLRGWSAFKGDMDTFLSDMMRHINGELKLELAKSANLDTIQEQFETSLRRSYEIFGDHAYRRSRPGDKRKTPVNKSLFDVWNYIFSRATPEIYGIIKAHKDEFLSDYYTLVDSDVDFIDAIGRHGGDSVGVKNRYTKIIDLVKKYINDYGN